jgi:hypothetical protein
LAAETTDSLEHFRNWCRPKHIVILSEAKNPRIFLAAPRSTPLAKTL